MRPRLEKHVWRTFHHFLVRKSSPFPSMQYPVANALVESWPGPQGIGKHRAALQKMRRLQILHQGPSRYTFNVKNANFCIVQSK